MKEVQLGMPVMGASNTEVKPVFDFSELIEHGGITKVGELNPYITLACDLRCGYCYMGDFLQGAKNITELMSPQFLDGLVEAVSTEDESLRRMTFLGGEPTLHPDITQMVNSAAERGIDELRMTTNGIGLHYLDLSKLKPNAFQCVSVSIDGVTKAENEATRGRGTFSKTIDTLEQYRDADIPLSINYTVTDNNINSLVDVPEFFQGLGAVIINFHRASLNGNAYNNRDLIVGAQEWVTARDELLQYLTENSANFPGMTFRVPYIFLSPQQIKDLGYTPIQEENYHSPGGHRLIVLPPTGEGKGLCYMSSDLIGEPNTELGRISTAGVFTWNRHPSNELTSFKQEGSSAPNISTAITGQDVSLGGLVRVSHSFKRTIRAPAQ